MIIIGQTASIDSKRYRSCSLLALLLCYLLFLVCFNCVEFYIYVMMNPMKTMIKMFRLCEYGITLWMGEHATMFDEKLVYMFTLHYNLCLSYPSLSHPAHFCSAYNSITLTVPRNG